MLRWFIYLCVSYISIIPLVIFRDFSGYSRITTGAEDRINGVNKERFCETQVSQ